MSAYTKYLNKVKYSQSLHTRAVFHSPSACEIRPLACEISGDISLALNWKTLLPSPSSELRFMDAMLIAELHSCVGILY